MDVIVDVVKDKDVVIDELITYDFIVLSPGPGLPHETFSMQSILSTYASEKPILGICLGMQGIVSFYGGMLYNLDKVAHGVSIEMNILTEDVIYKDLPKINKVGIYNSWACTIKSSSELLILSESNSKLILSVRHKKLPIYGLQFHPESILTENGKKMLCNFIQEVVF